MKLKGNKTGNKNNLQKIILFVWNLEKQPTAMMVDHAERVDMFLAKDPS